MTGKPNVIDSNSAVEITTRTSAKVCSVGHAASTALPEVGRKWLMEGRSIAVQASHNPGAGPLLSGTCALEVLSAAVPPARTDVGLGLRYVQAAGGTGH